MRPISVRFRCFGPYMEEQNIDFSSLARNGLFLICGETGAGKTTILDAMCYALYNQSSGNIRGKGLAVMRCKLAQKSDITLVEFVFSTNGKRYKFLRTLEFKRKNARDEHQCWEEQDGVWVPLFENLKESAVNTKAQEVIGLTYDQFRQVMILPQGQFEKLLISDSEEKEKILVSLFHANRWQTIADELYRRVKDRDTALQQVRIHMDALLRSHSCNSIEELHERISQQENALMLAKEQAESGLQALEALRQKKDAALLTAQAFQTLDKLQRTFDALQTEKDAKEAMQQTLRRAQQAQDILPYHEKLLQAITAAKHAEEHRFACQQSSQKAEQAAAEIRKKRTVHDDARISIEDQRKRLTLLESKKSLYASISQKKELLDEAQKAFSEQESKFQKQERLSAEATCRWLDAQQAQSEAISAYQTAQQAYLRGIGGILAEQLVPGQPCPVCGSKEHPLPAQKQQKVPSEKDLELLNHAVSQASKAVSAAATRREQAEAARAVAQTVYQSTQLDVSTAEQAYALVLEQRLPGIEVLTQLEQACLKLQRSIQAFEEEENRLQLAQTAVAAEQTAAQTRYTAAEDALTLALDAEAEASKNWQTVRTAAGFDTDKEFQEAVMDPAEIRRQQEALIRYHTDAANIQRMLDEQKQQLVDQSRPDLQGLLRSLQALETEFETTQKQVYLLSSTLERMEADFDTLCRQQKAYQAERQSVDADLDFAERIRGSRGLSLQRYVLGVMLSSITAEANRLLKQIYGGRYQLYRAQEITDRRQKGGLDLEILDQTNGQRRSVKTLSGGEKFLVALSLAIGLSTVVQAQGTGVHLEAMFIDEGFGSLDRDAICDALDILDSVRKGSGLVGIISHVEQLTESIPARIQVQKGRSGSTCLIRA